MGLSLPAATDYKKSKIRPGSYSKVSELQKPLILGYYMTTKGALGELDIKKSTKQYG